MFIFIFIICILCHIYIFFFTPWRPLNKKQNRLGNVKVMCFSSSVQTRVCCALCSVGCYLCDKTMKTLTQQTPNSDSAVFVLFLSRHTRESLRKKLCRVSYQHPLVADGKSLYFCTNMRSLTKRTVSSTDRTRYCSNI